MGTNSSQENTNLEPVLYYPLDPTQSQVRFIEILPSDSEDEQLCCRLETVKLSENIPYTALSYVWGDPTITEDILVNGIVLPVTTNLASALRQLRKTGLPQNPQNIKLQRLWADAICINQKDIEERNNQVTLMRELYGGASAVISWLGPSDPDRVDEALRIVRCVVHMIGMTSDFNSEPGLRDIYVAFEWLVRTVGPPGRDSIAPGTILNSLLALPKNKYWGRMWIVQEIVLSASPWSHWFVCGDESVTFAELDRYDSFLGCRCRLPLAPADGFAVEGIAGWYFMRDLPLSIPIVMLASYMKGRMTPNKDSPIPDGLFTTACPVALHCSASDPRDMIYGILGMVPNHNVKPDYGKPIKEVFIESLSSSNAEPSLYLGLSGSGFNFDNEHSLPSWLPDLTQLKHRHDVFSFVGKREKPLLGIIEGLRPGFIAKDILHVQGAVCGRVKLAKRLDFNERCDQYNILILYRLCVDYLVEFCDTPVAHARNLGEAPGDECTTRPLQDLVDILDWFRRDSRREIPRFLEYSGVNLTTMSWHLFVLLKYSDTYLPQIMQEYATRKLDISPSLPPGDFMIKFLMNTENITTEKEKIGNDIATMMPMIGVEFDQVLRMAAGKTLFKTDGGHLGIGPPDIKSGDLVCAVDKCTLPVLLRRIETVEGDNDVPIVQHVGQCYIPGLLDGEPVSMVEDGRARLQTFKIR